MRDAVAVRAQDDHIGHARFAVRLQFFDRHDVVRFHCPVPGMAVDVTADQPASGADELAAVQFPAAFLRLIGQGPVALAVCVHADQQATLRGAPIFVLHGGLIVGA